MNSKNYDDSIDLDKDSKLEEENIDNNSLEEHLLNLKEEYKDDDYIIVESSPYLPVYRVKLIRFPLPIIISILISCFLSYVAFIIGISGDAGGETVESGLSYGLYFTAIAVISSIFIAYMVKKKGENALKYLMGLSFFILTFLLIVFFGSIITTLVSPTILVYNILNLILFIVSSILSILMVRSFILGKLSKTQKNIYVLLMGILVGTFLSIIFYENIYVIISMLVGISIWDIISVKKGPIKSIMEQTGGYDTELEEKIKAGNYEMLDFKEAEIEIGVGDIAFYSVLSSFSLLFPLFNGNSIPFTIFSFIITSIGILVGTFLTVLALKRNKILPGLPLSIFIGLTLFLIINFAF
ncbi:MAG: hypothetical protein ACTSRZ_01290 [Promethearchaeota archaeon]